METKVVFRLLENQVIAIFPEELGTNDPNTCMSYMHLGQHGACIPDTIVKNSKNPYKAKRTKEVVELKQELKGLGYKLKEIRNYCQYDHYYQVRRNKLQELNKWDGSIRVLKSI
jgi:hypothetical protein